MKLNTLFNEKKWTFSVEVFPPKKDISDLSSIQHTLSELFSFKPDFISVT